jgi:hypothetical protein
MSDLRQQPPTRLGRNEATLWGSMAVIIAVLIIGGLFYYAKGSNTNVASNNPPPTSMNAPGPMAKPATPAPAPTPTQR